MPELPISIEAVTLTGRYIRPDGSPISGTITFEPPAHLTFPDADIISAGAATVELDATGAFTVNLIATDAEGGDPSDWTYTVIERMRNTNGRTFHLSLPSATPVVDLADIAPTDPALGDYVIVAGPPGTPGSQILSGTGAPSSSLGANGDYYVDKTSGAVTLHGPKAAGSWPTGVALGLTQSAADARYPLATRTARTDKGIYVPPGWGSTWRTKRDAAASAKATLAVVGGSASQGMYASNPLTKSWPALVRTALQTTYGDGGSGFRSTSLSSTILASGDSAALAAWTTAGAIVAQTGTWTQSGNKYGPALCGLYTETTGSSMTFSGVRGTTVKIFTVSGGTRPNFTYAIDGGAPVTVTQNAGSAAIQVTTVTGLSTGAHTVALTCGTTTTGQYLTVVGVEGTNATGVVVNNLAMGGASSSSYANNGATQLNSTWNGGVDYPADLVVFTAGPNDASANVTADAWATNVAKFFKAVRDANNGATDLMILLPHAGNFDTTNYRYQDYAARALGLAHAYDAAFIDMWALGRNSWPYWNSLGYWGTNAGTGAAGTDTVHPSDAGFQFMADQVLPILTA